MSKTSTMNTIFLSREEVKNPLMEEIKKAGELLKSKNIIDKTYGTISVKYGKRMLINSYNSRLEHLDNEDFVEVIDYNVSTNTILIINLCRY